MKILSVDAWATDEGSWTWNAWYTVDEITQEELEKMWNSNRKLIKWFRDNGYIGNKSKGQVAIEDDEYNIVLLDRVTRRPLYAIEYGGYK